MNDNKWLYGNNWCAVPQVRKGDMGDILLKALWDGPKHGYEVIRELEEKSGGLWRPSPGSVYPTLQLLEEEDLLFSNVKDGKKVYALTDKGRLRAKGSRAETPGQNGGIDFDKIQPFRLATLQLMAIIQRTARSGQADKFDEASQILTNTRQALEDLFDSQQIKKGEAL